MIEIGNQIPKVNGLDQLGETVHLADHNGKKQLFIFIRKMIRLAVRHKHAT